MIAGILPGACGAWAKSLTRQCDAATLAWAILPTLRVSDYRTEELLRQFSGMSQFLERAVASSTLSSSLAAT